MATDPPGAAEKGEMAPGTRVSHPFPVGLCPTAPPLLDLMRRLQAKLKMLPLWALSLLRCLQDTACQVLALGAPVEAVLAARGTQSHGPWPEPAAAASTASEGVFLAKVLGFRGCGLYLELH